MNAFCGRDKGGSACPYWDASQAGVQVGGVDGEQWLILRHRSSPATAETHVRYKCGSRMAPLKKSVCLATPKQSIFSNDFLSEANF